MDVAMGLFVFRTLFCVRHQTWIPWQDGGIRIQSSHHSRFRTILHPISMSGQWQEKRGGLLSSREFRCPRFPLALGQLIAPSIDEQFLLFRAMISTSVSNRRYFLLPSLSVSFFFNYFVRYWVQFHFSKQNAPRRRLESPARVSFFLCFLSRPTLTQSQFALRLLSYCFAKRGSRTPHLKLDASTPGPLSKKVGIRTPHLFLSK